MLRIENQSYDNRNPTPILIPIPISVSPPLAKEPRTITTYLYSIFKNPESKSKNQGTKTQGPRTMSHEQKPEPKSETHRTKVQDPKTITN